MLEQTNSLTNSRNMLYFTAKFLICIPQLVTVHFFMKIFRVAYILKIPESILNYIIHFDSLKNFNCDPE